MRPAHRFRGELGADRPSSCGQTTLLNALCGLLAPSSGVSRELERDLYAMSSGERDRFRDRRPGVVHQEFHLLEGFTAAENLAVRRPNIGCVPASDSFFNSDKTYIDYLFSIRIFLP